MFICVNIKVGLKSHLAKTNMFTVYEYIQGRSQKGRLEGDLTLVYQRHFL